MMHSLVILFAIVIQSDDPLNDVVAPWSVMRVYNTYRSDFMFEGKKRGK